MPCAIFLSSTLGRSRLDWPLYVERVKYAALAMLHLTRYTLFRQVLPVETRRTARPPAMLTGKEFGSARRLVRPIYLYERRLRFSSLAPSKTPPTANAAGRPRPISGTGARHTAVAQGLGTGTAVGVVCANAGTALRHNQIVNASRFIAKLRLSKYLTLTASRKQKNVSQINRHSQGSFIVNFSFF